MKNYHEIAERVAATIRKPKGAKALTEDQFMLMAGALAVELDLMRAQARAELIAERDAAFNRGMFVAAGIVVSAFDQPTVAAEIIRSVGDAAVKDVDEYDAGLLAPHFPQFAPYAPKE